MKDEERKRKRKRKREITKSEEEENRAASNASLNIKSAVPYLFLLPPL